MTQISPYEIIIKDIENFHSALKAYNKLAEGVKMEFSENGMFMSGRNSFSRGELTTNSVSSSSKPFSFCLNNLSAFIKLLNTAIGLHSDDLSELKLIYESPFLKIQGKKFKTQLITCKEDIIAESIIGKMTTALEPVFEFTTSPSLIKAINSHSFILPDITSARIYLSTDETMENNTLYATIGNKSNNMNNSVTLELGKINYGTIEGRNLILDFDKLNIFNIIQGDKSFSIGIMERPFALRHAIVHGKNDTYFKFTVVCSFLVS